MPISQKRKKEKYKLISSQDPAILSFQMFKIPGRKVSLSSASGRQVKAEPPGPGRLWLGGSCKQFVTASVSCTAACVSSLHLRVQHRWPCLSLEVLYRGGSGSAG